MEAFKFPLIPRWNVNSGCVTTPNDGFLYIGWDTVNYISKIEPNGKPIMKVFHLRQKIKCLDCDPNWSKTKYFVVLAEDNSVQIWDFDESNAVKGHKAHVKEVLGDGDVQNSENVKLCYLISRKVFSIDSSYIVLYCPLLNTYTKFKRFIPYKYEISIVKGSNHDEDMIALGTTRGLVLIVDLGKKTMVYTLNTFHSEITSLSWTVVSSIFKNNNLKESEINKNESDIFDTFGCDYTEKDTFGVPSNTIQNTSRCTDDENAGAVGGTDFDKAKELIENDKFDYYEECRSLMNDILWINYANNNSVNSIDNSSDFLSKQVTLSDCKRKQQEQEQSENYCSNLSLSCISNQSIQNDNDKTPTDENEINNYDGDGDNENFQIAHKEMSIDLITFSNEKCDKLNDVKVEINDHLNDVNKQIFLAIGSSEPNVGIWNITTCKTVECPSLKTSSQSNIKLNVCWIDEITLLTNSRSGELHLFKLKTDDKDPLNKIQLIKIERTFEQHQVTYISKTPNSDIIWTISTNRQIICEQFSKKTILSKYTSISSNIAAMALCSTNSNNLAFACGDRKLCLVDLSELQHNKIDIINFPHQVESHVLSLDWAPNNTHYVVYGTNEGRVAVFNTGKPSSYPHLFKPFSGKSVYSVQWHYNHIFACSNGKVGVYDWDKKHEDAIILEDINQASTFRIRDNYLFVGTHDGFVNIFERIFTENKIAYRSIERKLVASKYISHIEFCPLDMMRFVVTSSANTIEIYSFQSKYHDLKLEKKILMNDYSSGNSFAKWSNKNKNIFLTCGFDGAIRVWDISLENKEMIFLKQYLSPMLCGLFSPFNDNIIICAGKSTSIEMFDMKNEKSSTYHKSIRKKIKNFDNVQWALETVNDQICKSKKRRLHKRPDKKIIPNRDNTDEISGLENEPFSPDYDIIKEGRKILIGTAYEMNKNTLCTLAKVLKKSLCESDGEPENPENTQSQQPICMKLFGSQSDVKSLMDDELINHKKSGTNLFASNLLQLMKGSLKEAILDAIERKSLNNQHLALAPSISYEFWKKCCAAYAEQLFQMNFPLQASPYLIALNDVKTCINELLEKNHYREAWIIAKVYREPNDPLFETIFDKWITYLNSTGLFEVAALICALAKKYDTCQNMLQKRSETTPKHQMVLELLKKVIQQQE